MPIYYLEYCENDACNPPRTCAGYSASCVSNCKKNAPGCYAVPVPADCAYNAPGCNICGYARVEAIYCNGVHCGDTCVPHALCSKSPWCSGGGGSKPTNTPTPTRTPTPTPTPTPNPNWVKLKNTSFYTPRALTQSIPSAPVSYDADDDGSPYFIISSPASDPGLTSASSIYLGTALSICHPLFSCHDQPPSAPESSPCLPGIAFPTLCSTTLRSWQAGHALRSQ